MGNKESGGNHRELDGMTASLKLVSIRCCKNAKFQDISTDLNFLSVDTHCWVIILCNVTENPLYASQ